MLSRALCRPTRATAAADNVWEPPPPIFSDRRAAADAILGVFIFSMTKKGHE